MSRAAAIGFALVAVCLAACERPGSGRAPEGEPALEVEDVALPVDVGLSTEEDLKGSSVIAGVSGVLPSDFPRDLPIHEPSSVVDYGTLGDGWSFVELDAPAPADRALADMRRRLPGAGWSLTRDDRDRLWAKKAVANVRIVVQDLSPGSRIRVEYR